MQSRHTSGQRRSCGPWLALQGKTCGNSRPLYLACMLGVTGKRLPAPEGFSLSTTLAHFNTTAARAWHIQAFSMPKLPSRSSKKCIRRLHTDMLLWKLYRPIRNCTDRCWACCVRRPGGDGGAYQRHPERSGHQPDDRGSVAAAVSHTSRAGGPQAQP